MSHYAWKSNEAACKRLTPLPGGREHVCYFCRHPISSIDDAFLLFLDSETRGRPKSWDKLFTPLAHHACGPSLSIGIDFTALIRRGLDGEGGWLAVMRHAPWWAETFEHELRDAHKWALHLAEKRAKILGRIETGEYEENPRAISPETRDRVFKRDGHRCRRCKSTYAERELVIDHIVPVARGGSGHEDNLQTLCRECNAEKSDSAPDERDLKPLVYQAAVNRGAE